MALIVAPAAGAEAYISVADATAYFVAVGNAAWAALADDTTREQLLRRAARYMRQAYGQRWKGARVLSTQSLDWPRWGVVADGYEVPSDSVPRAVAEANAELALRAASGDLLADTSAAKKSATVGPISVTYADGASQQKRFAAVDGMLAAYLGSSGSMVRVVRA